MAVLCAFLAIVGVSPGWEVCAGQPMYVWNELSGIMHGLIVELQ